MPKAILLSKKDKNKNSTSPLQQISVDDDSAELIKLINITKTYNLGKPNAFAALKGITLEISKGTFTAIMGPSGSGKSSLMNILGALDVPTSGMYLVNGKEVSSLSDSQLADFRNKTVGFIFQQYNLLPRLTVAENVLLPTLYGSISNPLDRMEELLSKVGLQDKINNKPNQLSGGEMQRVAIARALMMNPSIIMADEPTGNLDTRTSVEIMNLFNEIHKEGNTIILITHEDDIAAHAETTINIRDGLILNE